jgi:hypothetical protein
MSLDVELSCPLGSECETVEGKVIKRCAWYTRIVGLDSNTGKEVDEWSCSMSWMPLLQVEMANTNRGQTKALESFRNETVKGQDEFNRLVKNRNKLLGEK